MKKLNTKFSITNGYYIDVSQTQVRKDVYTKLSRNIKLHQIKGNLEGKVLCDPKKSCVASPILEIELREQAIID
jgi:hypothetical protein